MAVDKEFSSSEIQETETEATPLLKPSSPEERIDSTSKVPPPSVQVHLYKQGKGPITEFSSPLGGWGQDQLEVRDILDKYGFKCIYAFNPNKLNKGDDQGGVKGRTVPIRFHPRNGRSLITYKDGADICLDGEPKDSLINPITRIVVGVVIITILIALVVTEVPQLAEKFSIKGLRIPPWLLTCAVIVFVRMRKRTTDFLKNRGLF